MAISNSLSSSLSLVFSSSSFVSEMSLWTSSRMEWRFSRMESRRFLSAQAKTSSNSCCAPVRSKGMTTPLLLRLAYSWDATVDDEIGPLANRIANVDTYPFDRSLFGGDKPVGVLKAGQLRDDLTSPFIPSLNG